MRSVLLLLAAGVATIGFSIPSHARVQSVSLQVDGLACPFCAYGLEKKLKKVEGVEKLTIDLESGRVHLTLKGDVKLGGEEGPGLVSLTRKAVKDGGFTVREVRATVDGIVKGVPGEWRLDVAETDEVIRLKGKNTKLPAESNLVVTGLIGEEGGEIVLTIENIGKVAN